MPCFDDADTRRGLPSVHRAFGEPIAVLTGDALIVLAFESLARSFAEAPQSLPALTSILSRAVGMAGGLVAGQAWESELSPSIEAYHAAKTGSLFVAAAKAGAASARFEPLLWEEFGARLGEAYQVADDIRDKSSSAEALGKPVGRDAALGRPNAVAKLGMRGALGYLDDLVAGALKSVPDCPGADQLRDQVRKQLRWLVPVEAAQFAA
jgi:geranylgeranyl diphosphate synthase, type II